MCLVACLLTKNGQRAYAFIRDLVVQVKPWLFWGLCVRLKPWSCVVNTS